MATPIIDWLTFDDDEWDSFSEEEGWESFSEDEPATKAAKISTSQSAPASQAAKAKKVAPKGTQGNIMSFFSKK